MVELPSHLTPWILFVDYEIALTNIELCQLRCHDCTNIPPTGNTLLVTLNCGLWCSNLKTC